MADPSRGVPPGLLAHVHLVSTYTFPWNPHPLSLESALEHLLNAPRIVREISPVAWQYLKAPRDGTILLAWQPTSQLGNTCATDGYVWAEPESVARHECRGYSLELFIYETGFAANERRAAHRRVRYRLVGSSSGEHVDPNLEIVHYTQSAPGHQLDPRQIAISPQKRQLWEQRRYLEQSGALVKKDFMLHDSNNWPTISMPARPAIPANPYQHPPIGGGAFAQPPRPPVPPQALYNQPGGPRPGVGPPPPKRARQHPPARMSGAHMPGGPAAEDAVMAEEDTSIGDLLDALSPREISFTRYIQHHEWMEEILMSPYAMHQILPVELGFGLSGDLAELTEGLFDRKTVEDVINGSDVNPEKRAGIDGQKVDELEKRVQKFRENGEMKIAEMKAEHVRKVQELSQPKTFSSLERRLAQVGSDDGSKEAVDDIVREAERLTKAKLTAREDVVLVQKGGLLQGGEENMPENGNMEENQNDDFREFTNLDFFSSTGFEVAT